jgi:hypothetical protein
MMTRAAMIVCGVALVACGGREVRVADPCKLTARADTTGWVRRVASDSMHSYLLPPHFARVDPSPIPGARARWADSTRSVEELVSEWNEDAFRPRRGQGSREQRSQFTRCYTTLGGKRAYLTSRSDGKDFIVTAWFPPKSGPGDTIVAPTLAIDARGPQRADQELLLTILHSAQPTP